MEAFRRCILRSYPHQELANYFIFRQIEQQPPACSRLLTKGNFFMKLMSTLSTKTINLAFTFQAKLTVFQRFHASKLTRFQQFHVSENQEGLE